MAIAGLAEALARFKHSIVVWFACDEEEEEETETFLAGMRDIGRVEMDGPSEPVYYLYCAEKEDLAASCSLAKNSDESCWMNSDRSHWSHLRPTWESFCAKRTMIVTHFFMS